MAGVTSFRDIKVWQIAMQLAIDSYHLSRTLPATERPALGLQLQQAAGAIPTRIAAGHKSGTRRGMAEGCRQALESAGELETLLIITGQLYPNVPSNDLIDSIDEVQQILMALIRRLSAEPKNPGGRNVI